MDCALWLNRRKIYTAAEIAGNPDVASLRGYLLAGTLIEWLGEHGGKRYAKKLAALSPDDERLNEKIAGIFGIRSAPFKELNGENAPIRAENSAPSGFPDSSLSALLSSYPIGSAGSYNYAALSSFGSFQSLLRISENYGSYTLSSFGSFSRWEWEWLYSLLFGYGSFSVSSFTFGSFHQWEWEWLYRLLFGYGSFSASSFTFGSFHQWEWLFRLLFGYGSFSANSFSFGSYLFGSFWQWEWLFRLLFGYGSFSANSFTFGSFSFEELLKRLFSGYGSFGSGAAYLPIDEYDLIMLQTLADCPLDRFGYGIHNI